MCAGRIVCLRQALPQPPLPMRRASAFPCANPVRAIEEALVVHSGEAIGELERLSAIAIAQIATDRALQRDDGPTRFGRSGLPATGAGSRRVPLRPIRRPRQQVVDPPAKLQGIVGPVPWKSWIRGAHDRPRELRGQLEADVGRDTQFSRQLQREPPADGGMRHDDSLGRKRTAGIVAHQFRKTGRERLHPIGLTEPHSRHRSTIPVRDDGASSRPVTGLRRGLVRRPDPRPEESPRGSEPRHRRWLPTTRR